VQYLESLARRPWHVYIEWASEQSPVVYRVS
jgi:hypothetical protein